MDLKINIDVPGTLSEKIPEEIRNSIRLKNFNYCNP